MVRREQEYVYGNVARQTEYAPRREQTPERQPKRAKQRRKKAQYHILSLKNAMFMTGACSVMACCLIGYLFLYASIASRSEHVTSLQRQISSLTLENDAAEGVVDDSVNLDEIKERAIELGMVYATGDQVVEYKSPTQDYVKQYEDIPENGIITSARATSE